MNWKYFLSRFGGKLHVDSSPEGVIVSHAMVMKGEEVSISFQSFHCQFLLYARVSLRQRWKSVNISTTHFLPKKYLYKKHKSDLSAP